MEPGVASRCPAMLRNSVVLPAPFGPTSAVATPGWNVRFTFYSTGVSWPYRFVSRSTTRGSGESFLGLKFSAIGNDSCEQ